MDKSTDMSTKPDAAKLAWVAPLETLTALSVAEVTGGMGNPGTDSAGPDTAS